MTTTENQREFAFLIKLFARYYGIPEAVMKFKQQFGHDPTPWQIAATNLGDLLGDRRAHYSPKENWRMRKFIDERNKYEASVVNNPLYSQTWRLEQYKTLYNRAERRSLETGNPSRCMDILKLAAQDAGGAFLQRQQTVNVDNRTVNMNLSNEELDKRLKSLLGQFGISLDGVALIGQGDTVIEGESDQEIS